MAITTSLQGDHPSGAYIRVPDMLAKWPWQRRIHPLYEEVSAEGAVWLRSFAPFTPESQHAFERCDFGLVAALMLPDATRDHLRTCVDLINVFFVIDEYTDVEPAPVVRQMVDICIDALRHPDVPRPAGEIVLGEITRQFWERGSKISTAQGAEHFVSSFVDYLNTVAEEAEARDRGVILTIDGYLALRLENIGVRPLNAMGELHLSIPDDVYHHPLLDELTYLGCEMTTIDNDILSYNREQATGVSAFNIVTVVMHHLNLDRHAAVDWLVRRNEQLQARYMDGFAAFPSFGECMNAQLQEYLHHMGNVRRAVWCWSFECGRYFGDRGAEYAKTELVPLIPVKARDAHLRREKVDILLMEHELSRL